MTVTVTLPDGATDKYMRFGDVYVKHDDGTLDVIRGGARQPDSYASGQWTDVEGDQKSWKNGRFWGSRQPSECRRRKGFPHPSRCGHGNGRHRADPLGGYVLPRHHSPERGDETSHRGGPAGFVYADRKAVEWPDYPGNNMFNSFGNLAVDPTAALLFIDFRSGRTLQLSGSANVVWDTPAADG